MYYCRKGFCYGILTCCENRKESGESVKIIVCMKQVPAGNKVDIDPETGAMKRLSSETRTNPYDLFALETALCLREKMGGTVTVLTMGPPQAESMMKDAFACGADEAVILSDRKFAGADVLATSYALAQGIQVLGGADLILCGRQTTDGDTAQVGPAIAEHLGIPHAAWAAEITGVSETAVQIRQNLVTVSQVSEIPFPCLITVDKDSCVPRLPSYILKRDTKGKQVRILSFSDMPDQNLSRYGLVGSPTAVERMFAPPQKEKKVYLTGDAREKTQKLYDILRGKKLIG